MKWTCLPLLVCVTCVLNSRGATSTLDVKAPKDLKMALNRLVRQQSTQLRQFTSGLNAAQDELREAIFALSEVFYVCSLSWRGMVSLYADAGPECVTEAPYSLEALAREAEADLNQCILNLDQNFNELTQPIEDMIAEEIAESTKLNFWLQSRVFARPTSQPLDSVDLPLVAREIFQKAVLWDNVASIQLYNSVRGLPGPLTSAGEFGFFCGYNACDVKLRGKLRAMEAFLNTNCATGESKGISTDMEATATEAQRKSVSRLSEV